MNANINFCSDFKKVQFNQSLTCLKNLNILLNYILQRF